MDIKICDICKTRDNVHPYFFSTDRVADAAGGMENEGVFFDLCDACALTSYKVIIKNEVKDIWGFNKKIIDNIKRRQKIK